MNEENLLNDEIENFIFYCNKWEVDEESFVRAINERVKENNDKHSQFYSGKLFEYEKIESIRDWFILRRQSFEFNRKFCVKIIDSFYNALTTFNFEKHAKDFIANKTYFIQTMDNLKFTSIYSLDFGMSLLEPYEKSNFGVIRQNIFFDIILGDIVCPYLSNTLISTNGPKPATPPSWIADELNSSISNLKSSGIIHMLPDMDNKDSQEYNYFGLTSFHGSQNFGYYHEYAHYISRHSDSRTKSEWVEYEADIIAINLLIEESKEKYTFDFAKKGFELLIASFLIGPSIYFLTKFIEDEELNFDYIFRFFIVHFSLYETLNVMNFSWHRPLFASIHNILLESIKAKKGSNKNLKSELKLRYKHFRKRDFYKICNGPTLINMNRLKKYLRQFHLQIDPASINYRQ